MASSERENVNIQAYNSPFMYTVPSSALKRGISELSQNLIKNSGNEHGTVRKMVEKLRSSQPYLEDIFGNSIKLDLDFFLSSLERERHSGSSSNGYLYWNNKDGDTIEIKYKYASSIEIKESITTVSRVRAEESPNLTTIPPADGLTESSKNESGTTSFDGIWTEQLLDFSSLETLEVRLHIHDKAQENPVIPKKHINELAEAKSPVGKTALYRNAFAHSRGYQIVI